MWPAESIVWEMGAPLSCYRDNTPRGLRHLPSLKGSILWKRMQWLLHSNPEMCEIHMFWRNCPIQQLYKIIFPWWTNWFPLSLHANMSHCLDSRGQQIYYDLVTNTCSITPFYAWSVCMCWVWSCLAYFSTQPDPFELRNLQLNMWQLKKPTQSNPQWSDIGAILLCLIKTKIK